MQTTAPDKYRDRKKRKLWDPFFKEFLKLLP